jgi:hypothetical protein
MSTESHNQGHDAGEPRHTNVAFEGRGRLGRHDLWLSPLWVWRLQGLC